MLDCYNDCKDWGKDCTEKFCKDLRKHAMRIVNYEKKEEELIPLTDEENMFCEEQNVWNTCKKRFSTDNDKKYHKVGDHFHYTGKLRGAAYSIYNLRYKTPQKFP